MFVFVVFGLWLSFFSGCYVQGSLIYQPVHRNNVFAFAGDSVSISIPGCISATHWFKTLKDDSRVYFPNEGAELNIKFVTVEDVGIYGCETSSETKNLRMIHSRDFLKIIPSQNWCENESDGVYVHCVFRYYQFGDDPIRFSFSLDSSVRPMEYGFGLPEYIPGFNAWSSVEVQDNIFDIELFKVIHFSPKSYLNGINIAINLMYEDELVAKSNPIQIVKKLFNGTSLLPNPFLRQSISSVELSAIVVSIVVVIFDIIGIIWFYRVRCRVPATPESYDEVGDTSEKSDTDTQKAAPPSEMTQL